MNALARYIEKAGTGTLDMIARLREGGLPAPTGRAARFRSLNNRDGNRPARAITTHLGAPRREGNPSAELCVAGCFNPHGLELIAGEAQRVPRLLERRLRSMYDWYDELTIDRRTA